jgi:uncharacterized glyoxalase superfamily protein PhnB
MTQTSIQPLPVVRHAAAEIQFYTDVFAATEVWRLMHYHRIGHAVFRKGSSDFALLDEFPKEGIVTNVGGPRPMVWVPDVDTVLDKATAPGATIARPAVDPCRRQKIPNVTPKSPR